MGNGLTLTRGARAVGGLVCAALAVAEAAWTVRDATAFGPSGMLRLWAGMVGLTQATGPPATSVLDPMLALLYAAVAIVAFRPVAAGAFAGAAVVTLAVRVPSVQILGADVRADVRAGLVDSLGQLRLTALGGLVGAGVLLVTAAIVRGETDRSPPRRPRPVAGVLAGLLLLVLSLLAALSQLYGTDLATGTRPPGYDWTSVNGGFAINSLLGPPFQWLSWATTALAAVAGLTALARAPAARPICTAVAWLLPFSALPVILPRTDQAAVSMAQVSAALTVVLAPVVPLLVLPSLQPFEEGFRGWDAIPGAAPASDEFAAANTLTIPVYRNPNAPPPPRPAPPLRRGPDPAAQWYRT